MHRDQWSHELWLAYQDALRDRSDDAAYYYEAWHRSLNRCACCGESFRNGESGALCYACRGAA